MVFSKICKRIRGAFEVRIGILTYYGVHSHGAVLQANALKSVLEKMGNCVEFLSFERNYDFISEDLSRKYKIRINSIPFYCKYLLQKGPANIYRNIQKNKNLNQYRNTHLKMGSRYSDFDGDMVIVGSDEVFSLEIGINPFMYGHGIRGGIPIISYAGCFGPTTLEDLQAKGESELIKSGLMKMKAISVRDENSKMIIEELTGENVNIVCDPVFLYGYEQEIKKQKRNNEHYVLIYSYDKNMNERNEVDGIRKYAKNHHLITVAVGYPHKWCDKYINANPEELIGYIKNAYAVVTDTFHGTVLSLLCNTRFVVKIRGNQNKLCYLLDEYEVADRKIESFDGLEEFIEKPINFTMVNSLVEEKRKRSIQYLMNAIGK